jgi:DNA-binding CsgD family transcriptional regulator
MSDSKGRYGSDAVVSEIPNGGRHARTDRVRELDALHAARRAATTVLVPVFVSGPAGSGRSTLLSTFAAEVGPAASVVRAFASECEIDGAVVDLVTRRMADPPGYEPSSLAGLLRASASRSDAPLVVIVDDAHWCDRWSADLIAYAARRLRGVPLLFVFAFDDQRRDRLPASLLALAGERDAVDIRLGPLDRDTIEARLVAAGLPQGRAAAAAWSIQRRSAGRALLVEALVQHVAIGGSPGAVPPAVVAGVARRLGWLSEPAQALVAAAAVVGTPCEVLTAAAVADVSDGAALAVEAERAGLVTLADPTSIEFAAPVLRHAVEEASLPAERARLHTRAADTEHEPWARLCHEARAHDGFDSAMSASLARQAIDLAGSGRWRDAAGALDVAALVEPDNERRASLRLLAAECAFAGGEPDQADRLVATGGAAAPSHRLLLEARGAIRAGRPADAQVLLQAAADACSPTRTGLATRIAAWRASLALRTGCDDPVATARDVLRRDVPVAFTAGGTWTTLLAGLAMSGETGRALETIADLPVRVLHPGAVQLDQLVGRGIVRLWSAATAEARDDLAIAASRAAEAGPMHLAVAAYAHLSDAEYRLGEWSASTEHGDRAVELADSQGLRSLLPLAHSVASLARSGRGEFDAAAEHVRAAGELASRWPDDCSQLWWRTAAARLAQARRDPAGMVEATAPLWEQADRPGFSQLGVQPWLHLYALGTARSGLAEAAREALAELERRARRSNLETGRARAYLVQITIELAGARGRRAVPHPNLAVEAADALDRALLHVAVGQAWRRAGRRRRAVEELDLGRTLLATLGARPFLVDCEAELAACGRAPTGPSSGGLTARELAVARAAAAGARNKVIAAELVVSVKTVEYHLSNIYAKLGVQGRGELALALAKGAPGSARTDDSAVSAGAPSTQPSDMELTT